MQRRAAMTKYFFVSDVHSYCDRLIAALDAAGFEPTNPHHVLVVLGDVFDRGRQSWKTYQFLKELPYKILIRGNHEDLLVDMINRGFVDDVIDIPNGTADTCLQLATEDRLTSYKWLKERGSSRVVDILVDESINEVCKWIDEEFVDYIEFSNLIGIHSCVPLDKGDYVMRPKARWGNPYLDRDAGKWRITGHWFARRHWESDGVPWMKDETYVSEDRRLIGVDSCVMLSSKINVFVYETNELPILGKSYNQWLEGDHDN